MSSTSFSLQEAIGALADLATITDVRLGGNDAHSAANAPPPLTRRGSGLTVYSYERWVRLRFEPTFGSLFALRFWCDNYNINPDWDIRYGVTLAYQRPTSQASRIATAPLPTADPGEPAANILAAGSTITGFDGNVSGGTYYFDRVGDAFAAADSPWLVFQASFNGLDTPQDLQLPPLNLSFAWREC